MGCKEYGTSGVRNTYPPLPPSPPCEVEGGFTLLKIFIPPGAEISLLGLLQVLSPSGICLIVRIPPLGGNTASLQNLIQQIQAAGGSVEFAR